MSHSVVSHGLVSALLAPEQAKYRVMLLPLSSWHGAAQNNLCHLRSINSSTDSGLIHRSQGVQRTYMLERLLQLVDSLLHSPHAECLASGVLLGGSGYSNHSRVHDVLIATLASEQGTRYIRTFSNCISPRPRP